MSSTFQQLGGSIDHWTRDGCYSTAALPVIILQGRYGYKAGFRIGSDGGLLGDQARLRLRDDSCGIADLVSAGETATRLREEGVAAGRAVRVTGEALRHGYRANEMMQLQYMVMNRHRADRTMDGFMGDMEYCLGSGMQVAQMYEYMMQQGWMGPGHMSGRWGSQHMDNVGGPGHHGGGGTGDDGHNGGMGLHGPIVPESVSYTRHESCLCENARMSCAYPSVDVSFLGLEDLNGEHHT